MTSGSATPSLPARTPGAAALDALPDVLAAIACLVAWRAPQAFGFDLLTLAAPLFFVELPIAVTMLFAELWRVPGEFLPAAQKRRLILLPSLVIGAICWGLFGVGGVIAVLWLAGHSLWRLLTEGEDRRPPPTGRWLVIRRRGDTHEQWLTRRRPTPQQVGPDAWVLPCSHTQFLPGLTVFVWMCLGAMMLAGVEFATGAATPDYAASVGWNDTPIGSIVPAHQALVAGLVLFAARSVSHFDDIGEPPPADIENDPDLQEIIRKVEGGTSRRRRPRR